jgi:hypothetical protein
MLRISVPDGCLLLASLPYYGADLDLQSWHPSEHVHWFRQELQLPLRSALRMRRLEGISAATRSDTAATRTDAASAHLREAVHDAVSAVVPSDAAAFMADTASARVGQVMHDEFSASTPSDTAASTAATIPAQGYDVVLVEISRPFNQTKTWLPLPTVLVPNCSSLCM